MAAVARVTIVAVTLLGPLACYSPGQTRGATEAIGIYQRSTREDGAPQLRGGVADARIGAAPDVANVPLTLEAAIALAKKSSAKLGELGARVAAADAGIEAAGQRNNPEVRATNVKVGRAIDERESLLVTPRLRIRPERPGEIAAREAEARAARDEARAALRAEEIALEAEIRWLFDDVVLLDAEIAASERVAEARRKLATQVRDELGTAMSTGVDADLTALFSVEADGEVAELRSRRALVVGILLDRIGRPGAKMELSGDASAWPPPALPPEQALIELALRRSPAIAGSAARMDGADARLHLEEGRRWPWLNFVEVGYEIEPSRTGVPLFTVGAAIEVPIFHTNGGAVRQAEASKAASKHLLEAEVEAIVREVRARVREVDAAAALVTQFRAASLPLLERARGELDRALSAGAINAVRALTLEERTNVVELKLFRLMRRYRSSLDALRRAVGGPLPPR